MRILVLTNLYPPDVIGGYELRCAEMVGYLRTAGHDVEILTSVPSDLVPVEDGVHRVLRRPDSFQLSERPGTRSPFWELEANLLDAGNVYALVDALRRFRPDVCYLWNLVGIGGLGLLGTLEVLGVPWLWHCFDAVPAQICIFNGAVLPAAHTVSARMSGRFLVCSRTLANEIEHVVRLGDRARIVPVWITDPGPAPPPRLYSGGTLRLACSGQLNEHKGVFIVIDAVAHARRAGHDVVVDLYGRGDSVAVTRAAASAGVADAVHQHGWLDSADLVARLRGHDLFAFPTWSREPFAQAPVEAAAQGCVPIISTPSGNAEWMVDGVDCLKARRDSESFADVIGRVASGQVDLAGLSRRAAAVARRDFTMSRVTPVVEEELACLARPYAPRRPESDVYRVAVIAEALARAAVNGANQTRP